MLDIRRLFILFNITTIWVFTQMVVVASSPPPEISTLKKMDLQTRKDFIESLKTKADSLKPEELFLIADLYMGGEVSGNVPDDRIEGMFWLKKSAEAGLPIAQYTLGFWCKSRPEVFKLGKYIKQSQEEAFYWFKLSAEGGYVSAYFELGKAYKYGLGCEKDVLQAKHWLEKAVVKEGNAWAMVELQEINMSESEKKDK